MSQFLYRGIAYDRARRDQRPAVALEHVYRGHHFNTPLQHAATGPDPSRHFQYRGHDYQHPAPAPTT